MDAYALLRSGSLGMSLFLCIFAWSSGYSRNRLNFGLHDNKLKEVVVVRGGPIIRWELL